MCCGPVNRGPPHLNPSNTHVLPQVMIHGQRGGVTWEEVVVPPGCVALLAGLQLNNALPCRMKTSPHRVVRKFVPCPPFAAKYSDDADGANKGVLGLLHARKYTAAA